MAADELWNEKTLTGIKLRSSEQKAARYLGFTDIRRFRAYLSSHLFLHYWLYWNETNTETKSFRLRLNFLSISFTYTENDDDERRDLLNCHWRFAQEVFTRLDQSQISKIRFKDKAFGST